MSDVKELLVIIAVFIGVSLLLGLACLVEDWLSGDVQRDSGCRCEADATGWYVCAKHRSRP